MFYIFINYLFQIYTVMDLYNSQKQTWAILKWNLVQVSGSFRGKVRNREKQSCKKGGELKISPTSQFC